LGAWFFVANLAFIVVDAGCLLAEGGVISFHGVVARYKYPFLRTAACAALAHTLGATSGS
jgi:hypothetical protein